MRHDYDYSPACDAGRVELELSLKPYVDTTPAGCRKVAEQLFREWDPLLRHASGAAVMLWVSDGSEILEYNGNLTDDFPWCQYIGMGNPLRKEESLTTPQEWQEFHIRPFPYRGHENLKKFTYGELKEVITALKDVGERMTGKKIEVIETFDPGPEFAPSDFKFHRHMEVSNESQIIGVKGWVNAAASLHAEKHAYATYPDGIPEGTSFGEFFGRQCRAFCDDLGFDGVWLSNGFGFCLSAWNWRGQVFDGTCFRTDDIPKVKAGIERFWEDFTREFGDRVIEARGSNLSTGMDITAHGCPIDTIYSYNLLTPPNSPWAALDFRFGLELVGYLSHIAEMTKRGFLFRYYTHDPWWYNSPWFDRYGGNPHDIYLPLSLARLNEKGEVTRPEGINFLSCDDSFGHLPDRCPIEVIPHILAAVDGYSDAAGLVTWVYPYDYYCERGLRQGAPEDIFQDDWYMEAALDLGFPVNTVVSDRNFAGIDLAKLKHTVIVTPVPAEGTKHEAGVLRAIEGGIPVLLYGSVRRASAQLKSYIGVTETTALDGVDFTVESRLEGDTYETGALSKTLRHVPLVSAGGITEAGDGSSEVLVTVTNGKETRAYATYCKEKNLAWVRGSFPHDATSNGALPRVTDPEEFFPVAVLLRHMLSVFGIRLRFSAFSPKDKLPLLLYPACRGGYYQTGYSKDANIRVSLSMPEGAPIPVSCDAMVENDTAHFTPKVWEHDELRIFVKQTDRSSVTCRYDDPTTLLADHRVTLTGLKDATVTFLAPKNNLVQFVLDKHDGRLLWDTNVEVEDLGDNRYRVLGCTGRLYITWQDKDARRELDEIGYTWPPKNR